MPTPSHRGVRLLGGTAAARCGGNDEFRGFVEAQLVEFRRGDRGFEIKQAGRTKKQGEQHALDLDTLRSLITGLYSGPRLLIASFGEGQKMMKRLYRFGDSEGAVLARTGLERKRKLVQVGGVSPGYVHRASKCFKIGARFPAMQFFMDE
ncbi:hypothetical protein LTR95_008579 [Oleoguttula sp. CCFEE 5521]